MDGLEDRTVSQFMLALYELSRSSEVLAEIGIPTLTPSQVTCLSELPLPSLCACLEMFAAWVDEGLYDFSALPFPLKTHMSDGDRFAVENELRDKWTGSLAQLLEEVMQMNDVLKHSETHITKIINDASQVYYRISYFWPKTMDYNKAFWPKLRSFFVVFLLLTGRCYEAKIWTILLLLRCPFR